MECALVHESEADAIVLREDRLTIQEDSGYQESARPFGAARKPDDC